MVHYVCLEGPGALHSPPCLLQNLRNLLYLFLSLDLDRHLNFSSRTAWAEDSASSERQYFITGAGGNGLAGRIFMR